MLARFIQISMKIGAMKILQASFCEHLSFMSLKTKAIVVKGIRLGLGKLMFKFTINDGGSLDD